MRKQELLRENNNYCPDLSDLLDLSEIGLSEDITGNPFMQEYPGFQEVFFIISRPF